MSVTGERRTGIVIVSHGSRRAQANEGFLGLVERVASRLQGTPVHPAFFSLAEPTIEAQLGMLYKQGVRRLALFPYFLFRGQHTSADIPALLETCRVKFPDLTLDLLPTLENDPAVEDLLVDRLTPFADDGATLPEDPKAIERRSFALLERYLPEGLARNPGEAAIARRIAHATADITLVRTLRFHPDAVDRGRAALAAGKSVICDVEMVRAGITRLGARALCAIGDTDVLARAQERQCTRAAAALEKLAPHLDGAIVAVGNAPTALWTLLDTAARGGPRPALVIGLPVGLVGAREAKLALAESDLCYITNTSPRGGSAAAAAAVNALAALGERPTCA